MKSKLLIFFSLLSLGFYSQVTVLGVDTLYKSGPISKRINLVIIGDGYTAAQAGQFITNATSTYTYLLNQSPFNAYKKYFNVFAIKCDSPQSGVTHPGTATDVTEPQSPTMTVVNNFDTRFDNYNIHRLIASMNGSAVYNVLINNFPSYDQVIILGNSTEYGGSGGSFAVSSIHPSSNEIVVHEMGHSFAGLADEYWAGPQYATEKPNMTANSNATTIKWAQWLGLNGISIYPHGTSSPQNGWYKPHQNCKMQFLNSPFCSVCKQTIIEKIHNLTTPIDEYEPDNSSALAVASNTQWFKTTLINPNPNTLRRRWELNSANIASNIDSIAITGNMLNNGSNTLQFTVSDTTGLSKDVNHATNHSYSVVWTINYSSVGIQEIKTEMEYAMYPNPATEQLNLKYTLKNEAEVSLSVIDVNGKVVMSGKSRKEQPGEYKREIDVKQLAEGNYFLSISINGKTINNKFVIIK